MQAVNKLRIVGHLVIHKIQAGLRIKSDLLDEWSGAGFLDFRKGLVSYMDIVIKWILQSRPT
jgi:hypothetical protein